MTTGGVSKLIFFSSFFFVIPAHLKIAVDNKHRVIISEDFIIKNSPGLLVMKILCLALFQATLPLSEPEAHSHLINVV